MSFILNKITTKKGVKQKMNKIYISGIIALFILMIFLNPSISTAQSAPPGQTNAANGAETYDCGALPPPGFHILDYTNIYYAGELKDNNGNKVPGTFNLTAVANVIRPLYVADVKIFGANPAWQLVIPIVHEHMEYNGASQTKTGLGDIYMSPIYLGWHTPIVHWVAGMDVIAPTGEYHNGDLVNIGSNIWTYEPVLAVSVITKQGFTASAKFMYDVHSINAAEQLQTGDQFHVDYNTAYKFTDNWSAGIGGYWFKGLQNDTYQGSEVSGSIQKVFAIGPNVRYSAGKFFAVLEPDFEMDAQNRPQGVSTWLKLVYSF
jgi:hypothetical protein